VPYAAETDLDKPSAGRRLRIRVDIYDGRPTRRTYRASLSQAIRFTVRDIPEQRAMFRSLMAWARKRDWDPDGIRGQYPAPQATRTRKRNF